MSDGPGGDDPVVLIADLTQMELSDREMPIYDRPFALTPLYQDPRTGAEHYLVRYPEGLAASWHRHTAAHTIVVIEGALEANGEVLPAGSYAHFPGGTPMHHAPAPGQGCLFVLIFDAPFDVEAVDDEGTG